MASFFDKLTIDANAINRAQERHSIENINSSGLAQALLGVSEPEVARLRESIEETKGLVMLFVHPYHRHGLKNKSDMVKTFEEKFEGFIRNSSPHKPPIFILEEESRRPATIERLQQIAHENTRTYIIPTSPRNPQPSVRLQLDTGRVGRGGWLAMVKTFHNLGIQRILVGGTALYGENSPEFGCVNDTIENLKEEFRVEVSSLAAPLARKDFYPKPERPMPTPTRLPE